MVKKIFIFLLLGLLMSCSKSSQHSQILVGYWTYPKSLNLQHFVSLYPIPGSVDTQGNVLANPDLQEKLNYLDVLIYAYVDVDHQGAVHFRSSEIDLGPNDKNFCESHPNICRDDQGKYAPKFGNFSAFARLDNQNHHLKKVLSVFQDSVHRGGINEGSLMDAFNHPAAFVDSIVSIVQAYHLDGVDLDLEPDSFTKNEALAYAEMIRELRVKLGPKALIFSTIMPDQNIKRNVWELISKEASYISDMCYDFHSPHFPPNFTAYQSNLYPDPNEPMINQFFHISCDQSIKQLTFLGVPSQKIILGYPSYGIIYGGVNHKNHGLFQAFDPKKTPNHYNFMHIHGEIPYSKIQELLNQGFTSYSTFFNLHISANWAYNPRTQEFISYDSPKLVHEKHDYVRRNHLAGLMTWDLNDDAPINREDSLLKAARSSKK